MTSNGTDGFGMSFSSLQSPIQLHHMALRPMPLIQGHPIGGFGILPRGVSRQISSLLSPARWTDASDAFVLITCDFIHSFHL